MIRHAFIPYRCYAQDTGEIRKRGDIDIKSISMLKSPNSQILSLAQNA